MKTLAGFAHVRNIPFIALYFLVFISIISVFPSISFGLSIITHQRARFVGLVEVLTILLAITVPIISRPRFFNQASAHPTPRLINLLFSLFLCVIPIVIPLAWFLVCKWQLQNPDFIGGISGLFCVPIILAGISTVFASLGRPLLSAAVPIALVGSLYALQHSLPESPVSTYFSSDTHWTTPWESVAITLIVAAIALWRNPQRYVASD